MNSYHTINTILPSLYFHLQIFRYAQAMNLGGINLTAAHFQTWSIVKVFAILDYQGRWDCHSRSSETRLYPEVWELIVSMYINANLTAKSGQPRSWSGAADPDPSSKNMPGFSPLAAFEDSKSDFRVRAIAAARPQSSFHILYVAYVLRNRDITRQLVRILRRK